jgi:hypothetical protein
MSRYAGAALGATISLLALLSGATPADAQPSPLMNFFVLPAGPTFGANQGSVAVSDTHCHTTAYAAGLGDLTWKAYMTGKASEGEGAQVARTRIGRGPFYNYYGVLIAQDVAQLHSDQNNLNAETAITLTGEYVDPAVLAAVPKGSELDGARFTRAGPLLCFGT